MKNDVLKKTTIIGAILTLALTFSQAASAQNRHGADSTAKLNREKHLAKRDEHKQEKKAEKLEKKEEHKEKHVAKAEGKAEKTEARDEKRNGKRFEKHEHHFKKDSTKAS